MADSGGIHVLYVDGDDAALTAEYLDGEQDRFTVRSMTTASEGIEALESDAVDCIVSECELPGADGLDFLEAVRDDHPDVPFILYTEAGSEAIASDAIAAGVTDYLQKEPDAEQHAVLANRIENAVDQYRATRRATNQQRINTLVRRLNKALAQATTQSEVDDRVCEILRDTEPYEAVWIGEYDADTGTVKPRTVSGGSDTIPSIDVSDDGSTEQGVVGRAVRTGEVAVERAGSAKTGDAASREAFDGAYQSSVAVPLVHDETVYGVVVAYSDRPDTFDEDERQMLSTLGETIGHALHRIDLQRQYVEQYRTLFEQAPVMLISTRPEDGEPIIEDCNQAFADLLGYSREEILGTSIVEYYTDESVRELLDEDGYQRALSGDFLREQRTLVTRSGEEVLTTLRAAPRHDQDGEVIGTHALFLDITDEQQVTELEQTNALLSTLFDALPHGVIAEDESRDVLAVNQRLFELFELPDSPEEVVGADCEQMAEEVSEMFADPERFVERTSTLVAEREPVDNEEFALADGRTFERTYRPINQPDKDGHLWIYRDITGRKARDRERRVMQRRLTAILENTTTPMFMKDDEGRYIFVNQEYRDLFDLREGEILGRTDEEIHSSQMASEVRENDRRVLDRKESLEAEERIVIDGEERVFLSTKVPIYDTGERSDPDEPVAIFGVATDITERKAREEKLTRQNERLEQFASVVSHDLRNPLNVASSRLELAREECDSDHLDGIEDAHDRMGTLIENLLTLAREGQGLSDPEPVDIGAVARECWAMIERGDAVLAVETDRTVPGDRDRLRQVFENLFRNAIEHGDESVTVTVGDLENGFYIEDDGPGVPESQREDVFEAGYSTEADGTGFGLSIVEEIVSAHGWDISVTEGEDGGARFEITGETPDVTDRSRGNA